MNGWNNMSTDEKNEIVGKIVDVSREYESIMKELLAKKMVVEHLEYEIRDLTTKKIMIEANLNDLTSKLGGVYESEE